MKEGRDRGGREKSKIRMFDSFIQAPKHSLIHSVIQ